MGRGEGDFGDSAFVGLCGGLLLKSPLDSTSLLASPRNGAGPNFLPQDIWRASESAKHNMSHKRRGNYTSTMKVKRREGARDVFPLL